ncbi:MAG: 3-hydroxyacyl-CoA dehydrogenase family protein [Ignavibacteria bacterium]|nr:3-hydroxyacyl-CoA dehydrogenase family protein [Ignavibacteria bacterium]
MAEKLEDFAISKKLTTKSSMLNKVGIVGCGSMGQDIAILVSGKGIEVIFIEKTDEKVKESMKNIADKLDEMINRWGLTSGEKRAILTRISGSTDFKILKGCGLVIEAIMTKGPVTEIVRAKQDVFKKIESAVSATSVIATNSSAIAISELSTVLDHPERAAGIHFLAPAQTVKVIEVTKSLKTSDEAIKIIEKFAKMIGKTIINVHESPGSLSTRLIITLINEACEIFMEGVGWIEDIDEVLKSGYGLQLGPFELADKIGLDKLLVWMDILYSEFGDRKYKASPVIKRLVRSNHLGRSAGEGFYKYIDGKKEGKLL